MHRLGPSEPAPEVFSPLIDRLRRESTDLFGPGADVVPLAYQVRPFSHVLRIDVRNEGGAAPSLRAFAKIFKPKPVPDGVELVRRRVQHEYEATRQIHERLAPYAGLDVVRPIACYPDLMALVTEEVFGETLGEFLHRLASWRPDEPSLALLERTFGRVGAWVRAFQEASPSGDPIAVSSLAEYVDLRLQRLVAHGGGVFTPELRRQVLAHIEWLGTSVPDAERREVVVHADFAPGNVMVAGDRVIVLDFAMMGRGTRLHDLTRLCMQLDLLTAKWRYRPRTVSRLQQALLRGYDPAITAGAPLFRLLSLLHRINHLGTMTLKPAAFPRRLLDRGRQRQHERWIARELARGPA